ncbi:reverse transcriptase [Penaeus vannamei]|uniref:RNA-directed DNA polymerase n=1 Tax=Penaeus vannamei TaxID=6689 RepID=A0A3R7SLF0_PENVA|nr:reverse transcriptase [Penaeus vannamei]
MPTTRVHIRVKLRIAPLKTEESTVTLPLRDPRHPRAMTTLTTPRSFMDSDLLCNVSASTADGTALVLTDHVRVKGCAALPSLYKIVNGKCQVHLMNLTPVPLEIRGGVPVLNFEFTDLPIREFDLPTPSPVCAASHSPPQVNNEVLQDILSQKLAFQDGYNILEKIFHDYPTVLPSKDRLIGSTDLIEHSISLEPDAKPVYIPSYKIPHSKRKALENEVQGMLDMNLIKRSNSPWASPMILVPKKDGSFRLVVDYLSEHEKKLRQVFERLASAGLTINPGKCQFFRSKLDFLGHTLTSNGIAPNQNKVQAVIDFPRPQNQKDLKSFLGLSGFYRPFIKDYGSIAQPLTTLLKKDVPFEWAKETEDSFLQLKALLANAPVLAFPDFELPFVLTTDASSVGLGATLHQKVNGKLRPIAFASRTLKPAERSYHTTDRELLAITYALRHFRELILGYKIEVHTDHSALTTALHGRDPHGRRARAIEVLAEYDVTIVYLPGRQNVVADALSRAPLPSPAELQACKSTPFPPSFAKRHEARTTAPVLANVANQPVDPPPRKKFAVRNARTPFTWT